MIPPATVAEILAAVSERHGVTVAALVGAPKGRRFSVPRHLAIWLACHLLMIPPGRMESEFCRTMGAIKWVRLKMDRTMTRTPADVWSEIGGKRAA